MTSTPSPPSVGAQAVSAHHLHALELFEEGEGHAASDDHLVDLVQHVLNQLNLVLHLSTAQDGQERPAASNL